MALGASGRRGRDRADREVRGAGEDVDAGIRVDEMKLPGVTRRLRAAELRRECRVRLEQVAVGMNVDLVAERGMRGRAVIALEEVLAHDLPVRVRAELDARVKDERVDVDVAREQRRQLSEVLVQWCRRDQRQLGCVERRLAVRARRAAERAVEAVRPRVVVALDRGARAAALRQHGATVATHVEERA